MKPSVSFSEIFISLVLVVLVVLFLDPFMVWMPGALVHLVMAGAIVAFSVFAGLVWKERAQDEREQLHRHIAGRCAYLAGIGVLLAGMLYQAVTIHEVDPWLVGGIAAMVIAKLLGIAYSRMHH